MSRFQLAVILESFSFTVMESVRCYVTLSFAY